MGNINSFHHDKNTFIIIKYTWHALNEHYGNGTDRMTCRVEWYYLNQHLLCVESMFVCECVRCQEWECPFVGRPCLCHAAPIGWTECLQYVIFIMDYCPSWTFHMALGLTMSHEHTCTPRTLYALTKLLPSYQSLWLFGITTLNRNMNWLSKTSQWIDIAAIFQWYASTLTAMYNVHVCSWLIVRLSAI